MPAGYANKQVVMDAVEESLNNASIAVAVDYRGLSVAQLTELRNELYKNDARFAIVKNTLLRRVVQSTAQEAFQEVATGPTALILGTGDQVTPVKIMKDFVKKVKKEKPEVQIKGGILDGKVLSQAEMEQLADLPSFEELRAKLLGCIAGPQQRLVAAIGSQNTALARCLQQIAEQKEQAGS